MGEFTERSMDRISDVVRRVERMPVSRKNWRQKIFTSGGSSSHWGTLGADLAYNETDPSGVDVTLIEGGTIEDVLPPEGMTEGTFASGATVKIEQIPNADGDLKWYVTYCSSCPT